MRKEVNLSIGYTNTSAQVDTGIEIETEPRVQCYGARIEIEAMNKPCENEKGENWPDASTRITDVYFYPEEGHRKCKIVISGKDEMLIMAETFENIAAQLREGAR